MQKLIKITIIKVAQKSQFKLFQTHKSIFPFSPHPFTRFKILMCHITKGTYWEQLCQEKYKIIYNNLFILSAIADKCSKIHYLFLIHLKGDIYRG